jgi:iduronate 2-sulfatase
MKMTNFENGVRIPFIVRAPWLATSVGRKSNALVEIVDLYTTLSDLAGVPLPTTDSRPVQGTSLRAAMIGSPHSSNYSFSQFAKRGSFGVCMECHPTGNGAADAMGFSVRSATYRYTMWLQWNKTAGVPIWDKIVAEELYDHRTDDGTDFDCCENENVVNATDVVSVAARHELAGALRAQFHNDQ